VDGVTNDTHSDCRTPDGMTIALIDSIITVARVLAKCDLTPWDVQQALLDMHGDPDFQKLCEAARLAFPSSDAVCIHCRWRGAHSLVCPRRIA
jgi:hypothetical protein